jgi:hypothetical protein
MAALGRHMKAGVLLAVAVLAVCQAAQAADFAGGTGDANSPYQIATKEQLLSLGTNSGLQSGCFKLVADIDLAGLSFTAPVIPAFSGTFDGNGHTIRNLYSAAFTSVGLFGSIASTGRVLNLSLADVDIVGLQYAGALAGQNAGSVRHCSSTGSVVSLSSYSYSAGGLIGYNTGIVADSRSAANASGYYRVGGLVGSNSGTLSNCTASGSTFGDEYVGGLVGYSNGIVSASYSEGSTTGYDYTGGLVGYNSNGAVSNCYSTGFVSGYSYVGGLIGENYGRINCCYSVATVTPTSSGGYDIGYLAGYGGTVTNCYYVVVRTISGVSSSTPGTSLTSQQLKQRTSLAGLDFWGITTDGTADVWFMPQNAFPVLAWQTDITGLVAVPDVAGIPLNEAKAALTAAGLVTGTVTQDYDRTVPAGNVIWAYPRTLALPGATIDLLVSKGNAYDWAGNPGNGTAAKPYQIQSPGQLDSLCDHVELWNKYFVLTADLDMAGRTYNTALIAPDIDGVAGFQGTTFTGSFNGNSHVILNLQITADSATKGTYFGLFGMIDNSGLVTGLSLKNATVSTGASTSATYAGTLAGLSGGALVNCSASGAILTDSYSNAGGLVGYSHGSMVNCQTDVVVARSTYTGSSSVTR